MLDNRLQEISEKLGSYGLTLDTEVDGKFRFVFSDSFPAIIHRSNDYKLQAEVYELLSELFKLEAEYCWKVMNQKES